MKKSLILLSALAFFGCASIQNQGNEMNVNKTLKNGEYKIQSIVDKTSGVTYTNTGNWAIMIEDNRFGMFVGCNRIFGAFTQNKGKLIFKNPASTKMMCPEDLMKVEDLVTSSLTEFKIGNNNSLENDKIQINTISTNE